MHGGLSRFGWRCRNKRPGSGRRTEAGGKAVCLERGRRDDSSASALDLRMTYHRVRRLTESPSLGVELLMNDANDRLARFEDLGNEKRTLIREFPSSCFVGAIYYLTQGRNAWRRTWSKSYWSDASFQTSLLRAQESAENYRVQGSQWTVSELACCVFVANEHSLLLTEINTTRPLFRIDHQHLGVEVPSLHRIAVRCAPHVAYGVPGTPADNPISVEG